MQTFPSGMLVLCRLVSRFVVYQHVLCQRMLMTPWALTTFGAAAADAAAATLRKLRRVGRAGFDDLVMAFLPICWGAALAPANFYKHYAFIDITVP